MVGATNPCKCGYFPNFNRCHCSRQSVKNYLSKVSQPLLDRIDLCIQTSEISFSEMTETMGNESSASIRQRVVRIHQLQKKRYEGKSYSYNSQIPASEIMEICMPTPEAMDYVKAKYEEANLTARTYHRLLRISRTIADMDGSFGVELSHVQKAYLFRSMDKTYWEKYL